MDNWDYKKLYNVEIFKKEAAELLKEIDQLGSLEEVREILLGTDFTTVPFSFKWDLSPCSIS